MHVKNNVDVARPPYHCVIVTHIHMIWRRKKRERERERERQTDCITGCVHTRFLVQTEFKIKCLTAIESVVHVDVYMLDYCNMEPE